jgi:hypothetical protein
MASRQFGTVGWVIGMVAVVAGCSAGTTAVTRTPPPPSAPVRAVTTVRAVPPCTPAQLALSYRGGGASAGNDGGTIVFRDTSAAACTLSGTFSVTGLDAKGVPDTATIKAPVDGRGVLSPHAAPVPDGASPPAGELVYGWILLAEYRDNPATAGVGICQPDWVIPARWRVTLPDGATLAVANHDPHGLWHSLVTCKGELDTPSPLTYLN